jgi:DNA-directed RNA polymerase specialized sigma24 family protein
MSDAPPFDDTLRDALRGIHNDDARVFYDYFEELKAHARRHLGRRAQAAPGASAVAQSALLSLFGDMALQQIPLSEVDDSGYPMLWPLLLKYVERHCNKWKAYYRAEKRQGTEVELPAGLADHRACAGEEAAFVAACEALYARLSAEEQAVLEGRLQDQTLEQIAGRISRSETTVSTRLARIRAVLEGS